MGGTTIVMFGYRDIWNLVQNRSAPISGRATNEKSQSALKGDITKVNIFFALKGDITSSSREIFFFSLE